MSESTAPIGNGSNAKSMLALLKLQRSAFAEKPYPTDKQRIQDLQKLKSTVLKHEDKLAAAINTDFGGRSIDETRIAEVMTSIEGINMAIKKVSRWMKPSKRHVGLTFQPADNRVIYQPLGVIGIIVPWNYPLFLALGPLVAALAAGNRAMIKLSEFTPTFNQAFTTALAEVFDTHQVAIIEGDADVASQFSGLPFDHLLFTGSTAVGKYVMRAAANNLTPVTLELGGKSPAIIAPNADINVAAERICFGKSLNAGQTCVAPDYVLIPQGQEQAFKIAYSKAFHTMYPSIKANDDYSAIISDRQHQRLQSLLQDADAKGALLTQLNPAKEDFSDGKKMPITLVENAGDDCRVMQEELFGPILPIISYTGLNEAIAYVNARPRPLALYLFSYDKTAQKKVLQQTHSGGVSINNTLVHLAQEDMPFGGIGPSGMGHYHGYDGFLTFSKAKAVHRIGKINSGKFAYPPYGGIMHRLIYKLFIR